MAVQHSITLPLLPSFQSKPVQQLTVVPKPYYNLLVLLDGEWVWSMGVVNTSSSLRYSTNVRHAQVRGEWFTVLCVCVCVCYRYYVLLIIVIRQSGENQQGTGVCLSVCVLVSVCLSTGAVFLYQRRMYQGQLFSPRGDELILFLTISSSLPSGGCSSSA